MLAGKRRTVKRYTHVYRENALATCFYILKKGSFLETTVDGKTEQVVTAERGQFLLFGMESLLGRPRNSTIRALGDLDVMKFTATDLNIKEDGAVKVARKVFDAFVEGELCHMSLFKGVSTKQMKQLVPLLALEEPPAGTVLFREGNPGDKVFIMMHGSVQIMKGSLMLSMLKAEQGQAAAGAKNDVGLPVFGEMALLDRRPRVATAVTVTDCKLLVLPVDQFAAAMLIIPNIKARLRRMKQQRQVLNEDTDRKMADAKREEQERHRLAERQRTENMVEFDAPTAAPAKR